MALLSDRIGNIINCHLNGASSAGSGASNATGVPIKGMESVLFLGIVVTAASTDGGASDGSCGYAIYYASNSANGSDAAASNAGMSCTDAVVTFSSAHAAGAIVPLEVNCSRKGFDSQTGRLFPVITADSVFVVRVIAIPNPGTASLPIAQTTAVVVADD